MVRSLKRALAAVVGGALPHIRGGKVRALGVSGAKRSSQLPDVPTIAEGGLQGYAFDPFYAIVVASGTPPEIMVKLAEVIARGTSSPEFRAQFLKLVASEVAVSTPAQMLEMAKKEAALIDNIVRTAGIKPE